MKKIDHRVLKNLEVQENRISSVKPNAVLGIDYGSKFCGLAFSPDGVCALPIGVFPTEDIIPEIERIIEAKKNEKIIIGLPISADGEENETCKAIREFVENLRLKVAEPIEFINERASSKNVIRPQKKKNRKDRIDDLEAMQILEFYLQQK